MKRKWQSLSKRLPPVKLYLDDINKIDEQMRNIYSNIKYIDNEYEFESLEELKENRGNKINELRIGGYPTYFALHIHKYSVWISAEGESQEVIGLWHTLRDFLESKVGWYHRFLNPWVWGFVLWVYVIGGGEILQKIITRKSEIGKTFITVIVTLSFLFVLSILIRLKGSTIYLERRHKVSSFWERNRDNIIMIIIGTAIGVLGTLLGTVLLKFLFK